MLSSPYNGTPRSGAVLAVERPSSVGVQLSSNVEAPGKLQQILSEQLVAQQQLQAAHHRRALLLIDTMAKEASETTRRLEVEAQLLREENDRLRLQVGGLAVLPSTPQERHVTFELNSGGGLLPRSLQTEAVHGGALVVSEFPSDNIGGLARFRRPSNFNGGFSDWDAEYEVTDAMGPLRSSGVTPFGDMPMPPERNIMRPKTPMGGSAVLFAPSTCIAEEPRAGSRGTTDRPVTPNAWGTTPPAQQRTQLEEDKLMLHSVRSTTTTIRANSIWSVDDEDFEDMPKGRPMFNDVEKLKEKVRSTITKKDTNVHALYKDTGWAQTLARNARFDQITQLIILFNAIWIAIDTDYNKSVVIFEANPVFIGMEFFFAIYFLFELTVRTVAFKSVRLVLKDSWWSFDAFLVFIMVLDIIMAVFTVSAGNGSKALGNSSILKMVKLMRLLRVTRMARLLRAVPELMILIKGMVMATRSVVVTLCLLVLLVYIFAIIMTQSTIDTELGERWFTNVPRAMTTLFLHGCFAEDLPDVAYDTGGDLEGGHLLLAIMLMVYVLLASLTVMNMLVGVLVDVVSTVSKVEKEELSVNLVKSRLHKIIDNMDDNRDGTISRLEFEALLESRAAARALAQVGVDVVGLVDLGDFLFEDKQALPVRDFMEMVLQLRGSNTATVKDIVDLRKWIGQELHRFSSALGVADGRRALRRHWASSMDMDERDFNLEEV